MPGEDIGTAMAAGFAPMPGLIRTFHIRKGDGVDEITPIVKRALALRDAAGVDDASVVEQAERDHLGDIAAMLTGHKRMRTQEILSGLSALDRATYGRWTFERLATELSDGAKPYKSGGVMVVAAGPRPRGDRRPAGRHGR